MVDQAQDRRIGHLIVNRYLPLKLLGMGGMGSVYLARDRRLGHTVALKFLNQTLKSAAMCDRFYQEATSCAQLSTRTNHIVRVTDFGSDPEGIPRVHPTFAMSISA
ncbi:MAG: hypothetical protein NW224_13705 [Leptolyngbyaceae cyanobacterium bins.302]|nr:hypothetical protein [Leptolyngbyaceae cyanobacterium bins.302]